jgi:hypothetical protein
LNHRWYRNGRQNLHEAILEVLKDRFRTVPRELAKHVREIIDEKRLKKLTVLAGKSTDLVAFREALSS